MSVRACALELGGGDRSQMLRFQNKYRSLLKNRRALVEEVMRAMEQESQPYINPYGEDGRPYLAEIPTDREETNVWASALIDALEDESGLDLVELANNLNQLAVRLNRDDYGDNLRKRTAAAEDRADHYHRRLKQLTLAIRDYLTTRDPAQLSGLRALVVEVEGIDGNVLN